MGCTLTPGISLSKDLHVESWLQGRLYTPPLGWVPFPVGSEL